MTPFVGAFLPSLPDLRAVWATVCGIPQCWGTDAPKYIGEPGHPTTIGSIVFEFEPPKNINSVSRANRNLCAPHDTRLLAVVLVGSIAYRCGDPLRYAKDRHRQSTALWANPALARCGVEDTPWAASHLE
jgi:hypothetical protein